LGGEDNIETAMLTLLEKAKPEIIGLCTTGLTETRGDDMQGILKSIRQRQPELANLPIAFASTPDFKGALQDGYAAAVEALVRDIPIGSENGLDLDSLEADPFYPHPAPTAQFQVTVLAGPSLAPGDVQAVKDMVSAFNLRPVVLPDLSGLPRRASDR
jgi:nitrogenase molybdenum-iron protein alpha/beta subunit